MKFALSCRVNLVDDETGLIEKCSVEGYQLTYRQQEGAEIPAPRIGDSVCGGSYGVDDVTTLSNSEKVINKAFQEFKTLLEVMRSFGGEEVVEI